VNQEINKMVEFVGPTVELGVSKADLAEEITNLENLEKLFPEGTVKDFLANGAKCSFKVTGGVLIHLVMDSSAHSSDIILKMNTVAPTPIKFSLEVKASSTKAGCSCFVRSEAEVNPFTRMMVEPALKSLFDEISKGMIAKYPLNL
tara:strand:+ start:6769 stop:7206 length:438 start_codon:yes stop_codon:yes gene_type:complete